MTIIHAFRRTKRTVHEFGGINYVFLPNILGDVTCEVKEEPAIERFLSISTAFRVYDKATPAEPVTISPVLTAAPVPPPPAPVPAPTPAPAAKVESDSTPDDDKQSPYVLVGPEGATFDLRPLDDDALRAFAKANSVKVHHTKTGDAIRDVIVAAFAKPAEQAEAKAE